MSSLPCLGHLPCHPALGLWGSRRDQSVCDPMFPLCGALAGTTAAGSLHQAQRCSPHTKNAHFAQKKTAVSLHEHSPGCHHDHQDVLLPHHAPEVTVGVFQRPCRDNPDISPKPHRFGQPLSQLHPPASHHPHREPQPLPVVADPGVDPRTPPGAVTDCCPQHQVPTAQR